MKPENLAYIIASYERHPSVPVDLIETAMRYAEYMMAQVEGLAVEREGLELAMVAAYLRGRVDQLEFMSKETA